MTKRTLLLPLLFTLVIALAACGGRSTAPTPSPVMNDLGPTLVVAEGHIVPVRDVTLAFAAQGTVAEVLVQEGDAVHQGNVLARLGDREQAEAALAAAQLELTNAQQAYDAFLRNADAAKAQAWQNYHQAQIAREQAQAAWDALDEDALQTAIDDMLAEVRAREKTLQDAQDIFNKYKDLDRNNALRKQAKAALDQAQADYNAAVAAWEAAVRALDGPRAALDAALAAEAEAKRVYDDILANGYDTEQKSLLEARLNAAKAQVAAAERALAHYDLVAPFDGVVTQINVEVGQMVSPQVWAVQVADFSAWVVETSDLTELDVVQVRPGQAVTIVPDALPDLTLSGQVESIAPIFVPRGGDILYTVNIRLLDTVPQLRWGMTVEATFQP